MAHINLLPWRETLRKERQREFATTAGLSACLMLAIVFYVHIHIGAMIDAQVSRNDFLEEQIKIVDDQIKEISELEANKAKLLARMEVIQKLQSSRPEIVHLFDELVRAVPEGVYLTKLDRIGRTVGIEGVAQSNARVSSFMRNLDASPWLENPRLIVIDATRETEEGRNRFSMAVEQVARSQEGKEGGK